MKKISSIVSKFIIWRVKHISDKNFVLILSAIVGLFSGFAAVTLKGFVHLLSNFLLDNHSIEKGNFFYIALPTAGLFLTWLVSKFFFKDQLGHGVSTVLYRISKGSSKMKKRLMSSRMVTSAITVSFGGSVGLEAPIVVTGSAIGSNISNMMHMHYKDRTLLIGCGSAAAVSAIFNSPVAGVIFAIEVILADIAISKFVPLLIASVSGALVSTVLLGTDITQFFFEPDELFTAFDMPFYIALGIVCGLAATYFTRVHYFVESKIKSVTKEIPRVLLGGVLLGMIIFIFPPIFGEGYETINSLLKSGSGSSSVLDYSLFYDKGNDMWFILTFIGVMILFKAVASALTIGSGGSGGIFAPSLFMGALTGHLFAGTINQTGLLTNNLSTSNFTLVGMAGLMSGVLHAPLTGIFLIAEITGGYTLFLPLMTVSAIAYITTSYFEKHSIYTKHLIEKGDLILRNKDKQVLSLLQMKKFIEKDFKTIHPDATLSELNKVIQVSRRNIFPVINSDDTYVGFVNLDDVRKTMFDEEKCCATLVSSIMRTSEEVIFMKDDMNSIMKKFENSKSWNLPVINNENRYIGFMSKSNIFNSYRKKLIRQGKGDD